MTEVCTRTLGEICDEVKGIIQTGPFGSQLHQADYKETGTPVVMPKDLIDGKVSVDSIARIGDEDVMRLERHCLEEGDIVYARRGDIGRRALVTRREKGWLCGTGCMRISLGNSILEPAFLYYYLGQPEVMAWIYNQAIGATMPNLNTSIIRSVPITYPPLKVQQKVLAILSAYDDLIENNTRRIVLLEQMAQLLYREWFVRFRFPGHESAPRVASELGEIPEGWEVVKLTQAVYVNPSTRIPREGQKPFVPMSNLSNGSMLITKYELREGNSGAKFKNGDTLFARITPCLENGKTGYVQFLPSEDAVAFGSTEFIVLRSKTLSPEYVYLLARSEDLRAHAIKSMTGATGRQRVQESCFENFLVVQPPAPVLNEFTTLIKPMFYAIWLLAQKNVNLRRTRDLLLPRLISGEVDVAGAAIAGIE